MRCEMRDDMYTTSGGKSKREFLMQQPATSNQHTLTLKCSKLLELCAGWVKSFTLYTLGDYISTSHKPDFWFTNNSKTSILHKTPTG